MSTEVKDLVISLVPDGYVEDATAETPVSEEVAHQQQLDFEANRAKLAATVLRETADTLEQQARLAITPAIGGSLMGVLVAMMQASGWKRQAALMSFNSVWGDDESTN